MAPTEFCLPNKLKPSFAEVSQCGIVCLGTSPTTGRDFYVLQRDEPLKMSWDMVSKVYVLGTRCRLPTPDELDIIYNKKDLIGGFDTAAEYPSSETPNSRVIVAKDFISGAHVFRAKSLRLPIRLVRDDCVVANI